MRYTFALAAMPVVVIWATTPRPSLPLAAKAVEVENIREQRMDENTFRRRWSPVADMPATTIREVHYLVVGGEEASQHTVVGTVPGQAVDAPPMPRHRLRSVSLRSDICARHGQRKVMVGKYRWRCRR